MSHNDTSSKPLSEIAKNNIWDIRGFPFRKKVELSPEEQGEHDAKQAIKQVEEKLGRKLWPKR